MLALLAFIGIAVVILGGFTYANNRMLKNMNLKMNSSSAMAIDNRKQTRAIQEGLATANSRLGAMLGIPEPKPSEKPTIESSSPGKSFRKKDESKGTYAFKQQVLDNLGGHKK